MSAAGRFLLSALAMTLVAAGSGWATEAEGGLLAGRVLSNSTGSAAPLPAAGVYAYQLADLSLRRGVTDAEGNFFFAGLPAGLYKIIAAKPGFLPAVVLLTRATSEAKQFLTVELTPQEAAPAGETDDFWSVREQVPPDVLRDILHSEAGEDQLLPMVVQRMPVAIHAQMRALAGVDDHPGLGSARVTGGEVGLEGELKDLTFGLSGNFRELESAALPSSGGPLGSGRTQALSLDFQHSGTARVLVSSINNRLDATGVAGFGPMNFERHRVSWSQPIGESVRSDFTAQYTAESNFYAQGPIDLAGIPEASRSWRVEGAFMASPSKRTTLRTGFRYGERHGSYDDPFVGGDPIEFQLPQERIEVFGQGGVEVMPALLVEYGLFSAMRDGSLTLTPRGGFVFRLGPKWRASTVISQMLYQQDGVFLADFHPVYFGDRPGCGQEEAYCYQVSLTREGDDESEIKLGAVHRKFAETLRLYFSQDFFNHIESLYLVRGDRLPELRFSVSRRLGDSISTRLESNVGVGGGGLLLAEDAGLFENQVRYLVTSLDTRFERTSTGVFFAFHHLEQQLDPLSPAQGEVAAIATELDRLQLMLTQDLNILSRVASDLAVHLNMELSRGNTPDSTYEQDELRRRVTGGLAVRF